MLSKLPTLLARRQFATVAEVKSEEAKLIAAWRARSVRSAIRKASVPSDREDSLRVAVEAQLNALEERRAKVADGPKPEKLIVPSDLVKHVSDLLPCGDALMRTQRFVLSLSLCV